jgi:DNA-binding FadR family transcriptional regulator
MDIDEIIERTTWDFFWVPQGVRIIDRPELLYLCSPRQSTTFNTVTRTRPQGPDHAAALVREVAEAHAGGVSRFQVTPQSDPALLRPALGSAGYALANEHDAMAMAVEDFTPRPSAGIEVRRVQDLAGLKENIRVCLAAFGRPSHFTEFTEAELDQQLGECTGEGCRVHRFIACDMAFHAELACSTGNVIFEVFVSAVRDLIAQIQLIYPDAVSLRDKSLQFHRRILDAVASRDSAAAGAAMREHVRAVEEAICRSTRS